MRVTFSNYDSPANPFYGGGGAVAIHEVARRLARTHTVEVVIGACPGATARSVEGVRYAPIGLSRAGPKLGQLIYQFLLPWRIRRHHFDLWCESLTPPFSAAGLPRFTRRPVVALTQILAGEAMRRKYHLPFDLLERVGLRQYRWAIATSDFIRAKLRQANPGLSTVVIPNGVPGDWLRQEPAGTPSHVLYLGRLDIEQKGLDLLLDALAQVASRLPLPVLLAGTGPAAADAFIRRRIQEWRLTAHVRMVGKVAGETKVALLRDAALLVMPSRFEASPLVLLEAACWRVPTLYFGIPELAGLPDDIGVKVPAFDVRALASALVELTGDPLRRAALGRAAKDYACAFDWDRLAARYERFFGQICQPRPTEEPEARTSPAAPGRSGP